MFGKISSTGMGALVLATAVLAFGQSVAGANIGINVDLHIGDQPRSVMPAPPPGEVVVREQIEPESFTIEDDVDFVYPAQLGFYVAVGVPYDLFYLRNNYYLFRDGLWFRSSGSHGPWKVARHRELPPGLRRQNIERIRACRGAEYDIYRRDREGYRGRHFMTRRDDWKDRRKAERERWKEARQEEKEYRKVLKRAEKEDRRHYTGWKED